MWNSSYIIYLIAGLRDKSIKPSDILLKLFKNKEKGDLDFDLFTLAILFRFGLNPNGDINNKIVANYVPISRKSVILLQLAGFDLSKLVNQNHDSKSSSSIVKIDKLPSTDPDVITSLLWLNRKVTVNVNSNDVIKYHSHENLSQLPVSEYSLSIAMHYLNLTAFKFFFESGKHVNYFLLNDLLVKLKTLKKTAFGLKRDILSTSEYVQIKTMLEIICNPHTNLSLVSFDSEQLEILSVVEPELHRIYIESDKTGYLDRLARVLIPDYQTYKSVELIDEIAKLPVEKRKFVSLQISKLYPIDKEDTEALGNRPDNSIDIVTCKDGIVWFFTSDMYDELIKTKINPYTGNPLTKETLDEINRKKLVLRRYGLFVTKVPGNNGRTVDDRVIDNLKNLLSRFGIPVDIDNMSNADLQKLLDKCQIKNVNLADLTSKHAKMTVSHALTQKFYIDPLTLELLKI